jgi:exonuclease III
MRVVSWNLNVRRDWARQVRALESLRPDIVVLQEVTAASWRGLQPLLADAGLSFQVSGAELIPPGVSQQLARFVSVASVWPIRPGLPAAVPAPEVVVCVEIDSPRGPVELIGVHVPTMAKGRTLKVETEEGLATRLAVATGNPRLVCGDFNAPKGETNDGLVIPFASRRDTRAHEAELSLVACPGRYGMADAFRAVNGYGAPDRSWWWKRGENTGGYRLDHIFASMTLKPTECAYRHDFRLARLSDHSLIYATFAPPDGDTIA